MLVTSFIRLVTNRKIFVQPTPVKDALAFIDALVSLPGISMPTLGTEWPIFRQLCDEGNLCANDIPDAWLAAAVIHSGDHLITFDADFKKLLKRSQLTILDPK